MNWTLAAVVIGGMAGYLIWVRLSLLISDYITDDDAGALIFAFLVVGVPLAALVGALA